MFLCNMMVAVELLFLFFSVRVYACAPSIIIIIKNPRANHARANRARACSRRTVVPNWMSSIVTETISEADWLAARVYAHTCFRLGVRGRRGKHTHTGGRDNGFRRVYEERIHRYYAVL